MQHAQELPDPFPSLTPHNSYHQMPCYFSFPARFSASLPVPMVAGCSGGYMRGHQSFALSAALHVLMLHLLHQWRWPSANRTIVLTVDGAHWIGVLAVLASSFSLSSTLKSACCRKTTFHTVLFGCINTCRKYYATIKILFYSHH